MNKIKRYVLPAVILTVGMVTPRVVYANTTNSNVLVGQDVTEKIIINKVEFINQSEINSLKSGNFLLGDFNEDKPIKIKFTGANFKDISKVKIVGGDRNKTFTLESSKGEVSVNDTFTNLNLEINGDIKKEIYGDFLDVNGFEKEGKNTGKYYFYIETTKKIVDPSGKEALKTETLPVDRKYFMEIFDTMKVRGTTPSDRYRYFNPEDIRIAGVYYVKIDFDSTNNNFNSARYKKTANSTTRDIYIDVNDPENNLNDIKINIKGETISKNDLAKPILVRDGSVYIPFKDKPEDGITYEVLYVDDFFIDPELKKQLDLENSAFNKKEKLEKEIVVLENEIAEINAKLSKGNLTDGEKLLLEKELKEKEDLKKKREEELSKISDSGLGGVGADIKNRITRTKRNFSFSVNILPVLEKQYEGFVPENYSTNYPILLTGKGFNDDMDVEFYGDDDRYYSAEEVRVESDGTKAYVYLPHRRKLRPGQYDIILRNRNGYETEVKYGVLSVIKEGDEVPNTEYFTKDEIYEGKVIGLRATSEDILELDSRVAKRSYLEVDLDELLGPDAWTRTIDYSNESGVLVSELKLKSSKFSVIINNLRKTSYDRYDDLKLRVGRATPYVVETFKNRMRNYNIKSDFIEVNGENFVGDFYRVSIPYVNSDGLKLRMLRYDEDLRIFEELSSNINVVDGVVEGVSTKAGIFVVVE